MTLIDLLKLLLLTGAYQVTFLFFRVTLYFAGWFTGDKYFVFLWIL